MKFVKVIDESNKSIKKLIFNSIDLVHYDGGVLCLHFQSLLKAAS